MASGLSLKRAAGHLAALFPLWGLCLVRLWALLGGRIPGKLIGLLALLPAAGALLLSWKLRLDRRLLAPLQKNYVNLLKLLAVFLLGAFLDVSYEMAAAAGTLLDHPLFHLLSALGSGLVAAALFLALERASRAWGCREGGSPWQLPVLFLGVNLLTAFYVSTSATVYVWDNAGYWSVAQSLAAQPLGLAQLREVAASVVHAEYNQLLAWPISLVMRLFGGSRAVFLFATVDLYLLPALWGLCVLGRERQWGGALLALLFPSLTYLALVGYVDVAPCAAAIWAVVYYTRRDAPGWSRALLAGACLVLSFLLRRYFLFFAASFGLAALVAAAYQRRGEAWKTFGFLFAASALCGVYLAQQFLVDKLTTNYADLYAAYVLGLRSDAMLFCRYFGYVVLAAALLRGLWLLWTHKDRRSEVLLSLTQLAACFLLLTRVQSHGQQHVLLYLPCLALLLAPRTEAPRWQSRAAWVLAAGCTLIALLPRPQPASIAAIPHPDPLPGFTFHGPRREDVRELVALDDFLNAQTLRDPDATAAVCASSFLLNPDTLINLRPSLNLPPSSIPIRYIYVNSVDKRDAFSWPMLEADYLVVGDPVQVHLGEENQQIIALVAHDVLEGTGLGRAYTRLDTSFTLQDGSKIYVYQRTREVTAEEKARLSQSLTARYPDYAYLYQVP